jgi:hypothetical protein
MNGDTFAGLKDWEKMTISKWVKLLEVHNRIVERRNEQIKNGNT